MTAEMEHTNSRCLSNRLQEKLNYEQEIFFVTVCGRVSQECMRKVKKFI